MVVPLVRVVAREEAVEGGVEGRRAGDADRGRCDESGDADRGLDDDERDRGRVRLDDRAGVWCGGCAGERSGRFGGGWSGAVASVSESDSDVDASSGWAGEGGSESPKTTMGGIMGAGGPLITAVPPDRKSVV